MQADFAVELGQDDEILELPWTGAAEGPQYHDLKRHSELLHKIEEAQQFPELGEFLAAINSNATTVETAKCDAWANTEINSEEEIYGGAHKFGSYVDILFSLESVRSSFPKHERWAKRLTDLLNKAPDIPATAEFLIRRLYYHSAESIHEGFYITFYLFGYGEDEAQARQRWAIGLKLAENAIRQILEV